MTTHRRIDTSVPAYGSSLLPEPLLRSWWERSGARSALPDAPVVADRPRRGIRLRRRHVDGGC